MKSTIPLKKLICAILPGLILTACAPMPAKQGTAIDQVEETLHEAVTQTEPAAKPVPAEAPAAVKEALLPPISIELPGAPEAEVERRFDIAVNEAPAREFFMGLVEGTPYNMVVHPSVAGTITLNLKNVTIPEVMDTARDVYGYEYQRSKTGYQVQPAGLRTRIFQVNYLNVQRSGNAETRVSTGQVSVGARTADSSGTVSTQGDEATARSGSEIQTHSEADLWKDLAAALHAIVGEEDGRRVVISPHSGVVLVRAMPGELREVEQLLDTIEDVVQRQVIIEAKIIEVELKDGFQSGINWAALSETQGGTSVLLGQTGGGSAISSSGAGTTDIAGTTGTLDPNAFSQVQGTSTSAFGGVFSIALNLNDFTAFIELLETQGNVQVLSSPRVATVNNQKAVIKVGTDEFFVTDISSTTTTGTATTTTPDITLTPFFSGIALDVTPQINEEGEVILHIRPSVSEVDDQVKNITVAGQAQSLPLAFSSVRESDSIIRALNGQVVVIGGLMKNTTREDVASVPLLGDMPFVGSLFRHTKQSSTKSELVILLRPMVVANGKAWTQSLQNSAKSFQGLRRGFHYGGKSEIFGSEAELRPR